MKQRGKSEKQLNLFEHLTQPESSMRSQSEYGGVGRAGGEHSSCTHRPFSVCAEILFSRHKGGSPLDWLALPSMYELPWFEYAHSHPMQNTRMNPGAGQLWEGLSSCFVEYEPQGEFLWRRGRGGSAIIR